MIFKDFIQNMVPNSDRPGFPKWVIAYFAIFFGVIFVVNGFFVFYAVQSNTGLVTDAAYEKGLHYNDTLAKAEEQSKLNIQQNVTFKDGVVTWVLKDAQGSPISQAVVSGRAVRGVQDGYDFDVVFENAGDGIYTSSIQAPLPGEWLMRLKATWDNHSYQIVAPIIVP